jgi:hypothetical protein
VTKPVPSGDRKAPRKGGRAPTRAERVAAGGVSVEVWLEAGHVAALDALRGDDSRAAYLRAQLVAKVELRGRDERRARRLPQ